MKKAILILIVVLILGALVGIIGQKFFSKKTVSGGSPPATTVPLPDPNAFQWGVNTGPNAIGDYTPANWQEQITVLKKLGVKWVRFAWEYQAGNKVYIRENEVLQALWDNGMNVILVLEPTGDWEHGMDTYQNGYDTASQVSAYYKGKITYYQILNEGAAMISKSATNNGFQESDYDPAKYAKVKKYLQGASKGIAEGDPDAKTIVTTVGTHTAYIDMIIRDGIKFDIIGLDWYSWSGPFATKKGVGGRLVADIYKSYGKPFVFAEVNATPANGDQTNVNEDSQSSFISETAEYAYAHKDWIRGFYAYALFDASANPKIQDPINFGIYKSILKADKTSTPTEPKKAFAAYQAIIAKYSK